MEHDFFDGEGKSLWQEQECEHCTPRPVTWVGMGGGNLDRTDGPQGPLKPQSSESSLVSFPMTLETWGWAGLAEHQHQMYKRQLPPERKAKTTLGTDRCTGPGR